MGSRANKTGKRKWKCTMTRAKRKPRLLQPVAYRIDEAAHIAGISRSKLYREIANGSLPTARIGRLRRILHEDLMRMLRSSRALN
jgi:excisionase family DNA binding protein